MPTRPFSDRDSRLTADTLQLLDTIHDFPYSTLNPTFNCLGDLHATLAGVYICNAGTKKHKVQITLGEIKKTIENWKRHNQAIQDHNHRIRQQIQQLYDQQQLIPELSEQLILDSEFKDTRPLETIVNQHLDEPDDTVIEMEMEYRLGGFYSRTTTSPAKGYVVLSPVGSGRWDMYSLVTTYIHEMMHAFYDADLSTPMNDAEYAEEPLAEYGMLHFIQEFVRIHTQYADLLTFALTKVRQKQQNLGIAHYGFGAYLFQSFHRNDWEHLMRDAHSQINTSITPYTDLQNALQGSYPPHRQLPHVAQLLHDVLTDANAMTNVAISVNAPMGVLGGRLGGIRLYSFRVAGLLSKDDYGDYRAHDIRSLKIGDELTIQEDFTNPHDPEAVLLIRPDGRELGYIPNDELKTIPVNIIEDGNAAYLRAYITDIQPEGSYRDRFVEVDLYIV